MSRQKAVQPEECTRHHMLLVNRIDKIDCLLFGCADKPSEIPLSTKVNIMFSVMLFVAVGFCGSLGALVKISMSTGAQLNEIKRISAVMDTHVNNSEQELLNHETRIIYLESCLAKKGEK